MLTVIDRRKFLALVTILLAVFLAWAYSASSGYVDMLPLVMVPTAHMAFLLFWMAFTASSIHALWRGAYSKWAMRSRRHIGLSFALVHFVHAALVLSNLSLTEASREAPVIAAGSLAYLFLGLMALTSNNWSVKKLGAKNWKRLHKVGSYYIWIIFANQILNPEIFKSVAATWIPVGVVTALALRIAAHRKKSKKA